MKIALPLLSALALVLAGCSKQAADAPAHGHAASVPPPAGRSWTDVVSSTADGGYRMGNPNAPVQLVEYGAFSCPHCKAFESEGLPSLKRDYVSTGRVSYEFRPFIVHGPVDLMTAVLIECRGPETFFPLSQQVYDAQDTWMNKLIAVPAKVQEGWANLPATDRLQAMATASGLKPFLAARGLAPAQANKCLADQQAVNKIAASVEHATNDLNVTGTPAFFINGQQLDATLNWAQLEPQLKNAVG